MNAQARKGRAVGKSTWTCRTCREVIPSWAACERHRDEHGHGIFIVLELEAEA